MNENINLCEILKGHEGETFYHTWFGSVKLKEITDEGFIIDDYDYIIPPNGIVNEGAELCFFPSKDQRDWDKWIEENSKTPKTWDEFCLHFKKYLNIACGFCPMESETQNYSFTVNNTPIEKSALALLKIYHLIKVGYGGNISSKEWYESNPKWVIAEFSKEEFVPVCVRNQQYRSYLAFHTKEQAEEFLSYEENIQLLKDYFMI